MRLAALTTCLALAITTVSGFPFPPPPYLPPPPTTRTNHDSSRAFLITTATTRPLPASTSSSSSSSSSPRLAHSAALSIRGGAQMRPPTEAAAGSRYAADAGSGGESPGSKCPVSFLASAWGAGGVSYILIKSVRRIVPIALEPFAGAAGGAVPPLTPIQMAAYALTCAWFAYVEGYKGFQLKFSPMVVSRARTLVVGTSSYLHILLAPLYSMGLFHATRRRMAVSWGITLGVAGIVAAVKRLPYPWRNIVDAGVVVGLTWGTASILWNFVTAIATGKSPSDPELPVKK